MLYRYFINILYKALFELLKYKPNIYDKYK